MYVCDCIICVFRHLRSAIHSPDFCERFTLILEEYLSFCGEHTEELKKQATVVSRLQDLSAQIVKLERARKRGEVCVYVDMYICMYACMYVCMYVCCMYVCLCVRVSVRVCAACVLCSRMVCVALSMVCVQSVDVKAHYVRELRKLNGRVLEPIGYFQLPLDARQEVCVYWPLCVVLCCPVLCCDVMCCPVLSCAVM